MGRDLFDRFPEHCRIADEILGYCVRELCLSDPERRLRRTDATQPALFVVNALSWLSRDPEAPVDFFAGHSLGEYSALFAAQSLDFADGLRLVKRRGELMAEAGSGTMAAVMGLPVEVLSEVIRERGNTVDIANLNSPEQVVLSGPPADLEALGPLLLNAGAKRFLPLNVSGAFHSRYMAQAAVDMERELKHVTLRPPRRPVIANCTGEPYGPEDLQRHLVAQLRSPVRWHQTVDYLWSRGVRHLEELGPGRVLTKLWLRFQDALGGSKPTHPEPPQRAPGPRSPRSGLGSRFLRAFDCSEPYVVGGDFPAIRGSAMVRTLLAAGLPAVYDPRCGEDEPLRRLGELAAEASNGRARHLLGLVIRPGDVDSLLPEAQRLGIALLELVGFSRPDPRLLDPAAGRLLIHAPDPECGQAWMDALDDRSAPVALVAEIGEHGGWNQAETWRALRHRAGAQACVGLSGPFGTPDAVAGAFFLGADFIYAPSLHLGDHATGVCDHIRHLARELSFGDTALAPCAEGFHLGERRRVMKRGSFFVPRAEKLLQLYRFCPTPADIPAAERPSLEALVGPLDPHRDSDALSTAAVAYLEKAQDWAIRGDLEHRLSFRVPCDDAPAAWREHCGRHGIAGNQAFQTVPTIRRLMDEARDFTSRRRRDLEAMEPRS